MGASAVGSPKYRVPVRGFSPDLGVLGGKGQEATLLVEEKLSSVQSSPGGGDLELRLDGKGL